MSTKKPSPKTTLMQDLMELGLAIPVNPKMDNGVEHVIREDSHLDGGTFGLRVRTTAEKMDIFNWKPDIRVKIIDMSRKEALALAALINKTWPLDALGQS